MPTTLKLRMRPLPQWPPVALRAPQEAVEVRLSTGRGEFDVTRAAVVAALSPLTLAVGLDAQRYPQSKTARSRAAFRRSRSRRTVGMLQLQHTGIGHFRGRDRTVRCPTGTHVACAGRIGPGTAGCKIAGCAETRIQIISSCLHEAVQQQMIFYICPRPVVLVSVDDGSHSNLFPMDLIGPVSWIVSRWRCAVPARQ